MLAAREALELTRSMIESFLTPSSNAIPERAVHAEYIAIVCMLRAIGHVLIADCDKAPLNVYLKARWGTWGQDPIFKTYIKPTRDDLLKEFKGRRQLPADDGASPRIYASPEPITVWHFDPERLRDEGGRLVAPYFRQSLQFWQRAVSDIEAEAGRLGLS